MDVHAYQKQIHLLYKKSNQSNSFFFRPHLKQYHLTHEEFKVLSIVHNKEGCTIGEVAEHLHLDAANISTTCKKLESLGYLSQIHNTLDKHIIDLSLNEAGTICVKDCISFCKLHYEKQWARYNKKDQNAIYNILKKMNQHLEKNEERTY